MANETQDYAIFYYSQKRLRGQNYSSPRLSLDA
ncbi:hypothetical protein OKW40_000474 [Paraburkholderia sp. RAU6.4a]